MKVKIMAIILSVNLLFLGCSSKVAGFDNGSYENSSDVQNTSVGEKVIYGTLGVGVGVYILTTIAVVILLLVPKAQEER